MREQFNLSIVVVVLTLCGGLFGSCAFFTVIPLRDVSAALVLPVHRAGVEINLPRQSHDRQLLKFAGDPTVFLVLADGLHPFDSFSHFENYLQARGEAPRLRLLTTTSRRFTVSPVFAQDT